MNRARSTPSRQRGFTLIELMVVIVIIGLLVGLVVANPFAALFEAQEETARNQMKNIADAIQLYELQHRKIPASLQELTVKDERSGQAYMKEIPKDPWGNDYDYRPQDRRTFVIVSAGDNGVPDDDDDIRYPPEDER
jgi:general secretion pathway protein G